MSEQFLKYYKSIKKNFYIIKKNNNKKIYKIRDGRIVFSVDLKNIKCGLCDNTSLCELKKCNHIYQLFNTEFNVPEEKLEFLWKNDNHARVLDGEEIVLKEEDLDCVICLEFVFDKNSYKKRICCLNCGKYYHHKCLNRCNKFECLNCKNDWRTKLQFKN